MQPLFETIIDYIPAPEGDENADTQVLSVQSITTNMLDVSVLVRLTMVN